MIVYLNHDGILAIEILVDFPMNVAVIVTDQVFVLSWSKIGDDSRKPFLLRFKKNFDPRAERISAPYAQASNKIGNLDLKSILEIF
jgi:hypothetical protein